MHLDTGPNTANKLQELIFIRLYIHTILTWLTANPRTPCAFRYAVTKPWKPLSNASRHSFSYNGMPPA
jgi:hypothetical protein